jgi:hypothetical protein
VNYDVEEKTSTNSNRNSLLLLLLDLHDFRVVIHRGNHVLLQLLGSENLGESRRKSSWRSVRKWVGTQTKGKTGRNRVKSR